MIFIHANVGVHDCTNGWKVPSPYSILNELTPVIFVTTKQKYVYGIGISTDLLIQVSKLIVPSLAFFAGTNVRMSNFAPK